MSAEKIKKALEKKKKLDKKNKIKNTFDGSTFPKKIKIDDDLPKIKNTYGPNRNSQEGGGKQMLRGGGIAIRGLGRAFQKGGKV